jgi:large subunit ribosomal protein L1
VKVLVFTNDPAGAFAACVDKAGLHDVLHKINDGWFDFDVAVVIISAMTKVRSAARIVDPRGLMPNPKTGTVSDDLPSAIQAVKTRRVAFEMDKTVNLSIVIGKQSFNVQNLAENCDVGIYVLSKMRPMEFRSKFVELMTIEGVMIPGIGLSQKIFENLIRKWK